MKTKIIKASELGDDWTAEHHIKPRDEASLLIAYEAGELDNEDEMELFQRLVNNGHAWSLQGSYGRTAAALIDAGLVSDGRGRR